LSKESKTCVGEKAASSMNGARKTGYLVSTSHPVQKSTQSGSKILI
jgi:hypothetical protein